MKKSYQKKGFTILEMLLSIALISIIFAFSSPVFQQVQTMRNENTEIEHIKAFIYRAEHLAYSGFHDDDWGLYCELDTLTLFKGDDYDSRDIDFDETFIFKNIVFDEISETIFLKNSGILSGFVDIQITTQTGDSLIVNINEQGVVTEIS